MRKYKDVGKRILVLVLSVCMIAGVLPAIPAEAADAFPGNGKITLGADANGATATGNDTYTYTGQEVKPAVTVQIDGVTLKEKRITPFITVIIPAQEQHILISLVSETATDGRPPRALRLHSRS